jgi:formylglycine-generating enzyme required for sulfatase activity
VETVSWNDVQEFLRKLNAREKTTRYRLPTEAEWEYACRAGGQEPDEAANLDDIAWWKDNSGDRTHPVGQKKANLWGLYDMRGNVWEWVQDWSGPYSAEPQIDPQGAQSGELRVVRGGSWNNVSTDDFRCAFRNQGVPGLGYDFLHGDAGTFGFRCARTF